jgi:hypothetical protein
MSFPFKELSADICQKISDLSGNGLLSGSASYLFAAAGVREPQRNQINICRLQSDRSICRRSYIVKLLKKLLNLSNQFAAAFPPKRSRSKEFAFPADVCQKISSGLSGNGLISISLMHLYQLNLLPPQHKFCS